MRDLEKERELLEKAGLADVQEGEALAAARWNGMSATVEGEPTTPPAEGYSSPVGGNSRRTPREAETPLEALARLNEEAWRDVQRLAPEIAAQHEAERIHELTRIGASWRTWGAANHPLVMARHSAERMIERLLAFLEAIQGDAELTEDDPGGGDICDEPHDDNELEPSMAVPECHEWRSQAATWAHAAIGLKAANDELERDIDTEEDDALDHKECGEDDLCEGDNDIEFGEGDPFPYQPSGRRVVSAPTDACIPAVKAALRDPARRKDVIKPARNGLGPIIASWRVE